MTHFENVLDEPDIVEPTGDEPAYTSYPATATRDGAQWSVTVHDLPDGVAVQAQGATWADAQINAIKGVIGALKADIGTIGVHLEPANPEAAAALQAVTAARVSRAEIEQAERDAVRHAARLLTGQGWSTRDAGRALGLSHQRISQLAPRAAS